jgi:hypothetical protein
MACHTDAKLRCALAAASILVAITALISAAHAANAPCQKSDDDFYEPVVEGPTEPLIDSAGKCLDKGKSATHWTGPEHWAWEQICRRQMADFDRQYCPSGEHADLQSLDQDSRRRISGEFIRQILEVDTYASEVRSGSISIVGASIDHINVADAEIGAFILSRTRIAGDVSFTNVTNTRTIILSQSEVVGNLRFKRVKGGDIAVSATKMAEVSAEQLDITRLRLTGDTAQNLNIGLSRLSDQLSILMGEYGDIWFSTTKSDGLFVRLGKVSTFHLTNFADGGMFVLDIQNWVGNSVLSLRSVTVGTFQLIGTGRLAQSAASIPHTTSILGFTFTDADWGSDPVPYLSALMKTSDDYIPSVYTGLAKSYAAAGRPDLARDILITQSDAELHNSSTTWFRKSYLWATKYLVAYGYRPEIGLAWIFAFTLISTLVFRSGSQTIIAGEQPRSWFVFALNAVIPGISLDSDYEKIAFFGWRQWFLYFLRFLGAVVVVLILSFVRNAIFGAS